MAKTNGEKEFNRYMKEISASKAAKPRFKFDEKNGFFCEKFVSEFKSEVSYFPKTYANRTQAQNAILKLGKHKLTGPALFEITGKRPFFVCYKGDITAANQILSNLKKL